MGQGVRTRLTDAPPERPPHVTPPDRSSGHQVPCGVGWAARLPDRDRRGAAIPGGIPRSAGDVVLSDRRRLDRWLSEPPAAPRIDDDASSR